MDSNPKNDEFDEIAGQNFANRLIANKLIYRQGVTKSIEANEVTLRQVAAGMVTTENLSASGSAIGIVKTQAAGLANLNAGVIAVGGNADLDQTGSTVVVTGGNADMDQCGSGFVVANNVQFKNSLAAVVIAQKVEGDVTTLFATKDAIVFGVVAGLVSGLIALVSRLFRSRK